MCMAHSLSTGAKKFLLSVTLVLALIPLSANAADCMLGSIKVFDGDSITAYQDWVMGAGQACVSQRRICTNGTLSGSFSATSCMPGSGVSSCSFDGQTMQNGASVTAYQAGQVLAGQLCVSETRTCTGGTLEGTYLFAACSVQQSGAPPASCTAPWGASVAHGESVTAHASASVPQGQQCASHTRTCSNGTLSGSYLHQNCTAPTPPPPPSSPPPPPGDTSNAGKRVLLLFHNEPVFSAPNFNAFDQIGTQPQSTLGTVLEGPTNQTQQSGAVVTFYKINFDSGVDGWVKHTMTGQGSPALQFLVPSIGANPTSGTAPLAVGFSAYVPDNAAQTGNSIDPGDGSGPKPITWVGNCNQGICNAGSRLHQYMTVGTFIARLTNSTGSVIATANVAVESAGATPTPPTCTLAAQPASITQGQSSALTVNTPDTSISMATVNNGVGIVSLVGGLGSRTITPTQTTTYTATVTKNGLSGTCSTSVTVGAPPPNQPSIMLITPTEGQVVQKGSIVPISWSSQNAPSDASVTVSFPAFNTQYAIAGMSVSGSYNWTVPTYLTPGSGYTVHVSLFKGTTLDRKEVHVAVVEPGGSPLPSCNLSASPTTISSGQSSTLTLVSHHATSASINNNIGSLALNGTRSVSPAQTTTYVATVVGQGGTATCNATVRLSSTVAAPYFTIGERVRATANLNVRSTQNGTLLGMQPANALGTVVGGPQNANGFTWWRVDWDNSTVDGWSVQEYLVEAAVTIPAPPPPPSSQFSIGDRVQPTSVLNVRATPSTSGTLVGTQNVAARGTVTSGPQSSNSYTWWQVNWGSGADGWSVGSYLTEANTTAAPGGPVSCTLSPISTNILVGQSTQITLTSHNATSASINNGIGSVAPNSTTTVSPTQTTTYIATVNGASGSATCTASTITVTQPVAGTCYLGGSPFPCGNPAIIQDHKNQGFTYKVPASQVPRLCQRPTVNTSCKSFGGDCVSANGTVVKNNESAMFYQGTAVPKDAPISISGNKCRSQLRWCIYGRLSGSYEQSSCSVDETRTLAEMPLPPEGRACTQGDLQVWDGGVAGGFFDSDVTAGELAAGSYADGEARLCINGTFTGNARFLYARNDPDLYSPVVGKSCVYSTPSGPSGELPHGQSITLYTNSIEPVGGTCTPATLTCRDGLLNGIPFGSSGHTVRSTGSGLWRYPTCQVSTNPASPAPPRHCMFDGKKVLGDVYAYTTTRVPAGTRCRYEVRTCSNGTLSGSYPHSTCVVDGTNVDAPRRAGFCYVDGHRVSAGDRPSLFYFKHGVNLISAGTPGGFLCLNNGSLQDTINIFPGFLNLFIPHSNYLDNGYIQRTFLHTYFTDLSNGIMYGKASKGAIETLQGQNGELERYGDTTGFAPKGDASQLASALAALQSAFEAIRKLLRQ